MRTVPRSKKSAPRVRERVATPEELADEAQRWNRAREARRVVAPEPIEGNLCAVLVTFAAWQRCAVCGSLTLYVNSQAQTDGDFECGLCVEVREDLARRLRYTKLASRVATHLHTLLAIANDNGVRV